MAPLAERELSPEVSRASSCWTSRAPAARACGRTCGWRCASSGRPFRTRAFRSPDLVTFNKSTSLPQKIHVFHPSSRNKVRFSPKYRSRSRQVLSAHLPVRYGVRPLWSREREGLLCLDYAAEHAETRKFTVRCIGKFTQSPNWIGTTLVLNSVGQSVCGGGYSALQPHPGP